MSSLSDHFCKLHKQWLTTVQFVFTCENPCQIFAHESVFVPFKGRIDDTKKVGCNLVHFYTSRNNNGDYVTDWKLIYTSCFSLTLHFQSTVFAVNCSCCTFRGIIWRHRVHNMMNSLNIAISFRLLLSHLNNLFAVSSPLCYCVDLIAIQPRIQYSWLV